ncbi:hypothetical protein HYY72_03780 [Candidatus Woesearchaeota archaeon]|nr:hypothetical protein [Candidatus Woesearchaeota archaeon]
MAMKHWEILGLILVSALVVFNSLQVISVSAALGEKAFPFLGGSSGSSSQSSFKVKSGGDVVQNVIAAMIPSGTPEYGSELSVSFDDPINSLNTLAKLDRQIPVSQLSADEKARFINITTRISCEFCCGAPAVTDQNGRDLCGCSHAQSFRGLAKYLVKNHPKEYSDEQVLVQLTKWKALYYPKNMVEKGVAAVENGLELTPAVLNDPNLLKKLKSGDTSKVGDANLPTMVGGC